VVLTIHAHLAPALNKEESCTSAVDFRDVLLGRAGEPLRGLVPKMPINFEEILSHALGNFEEQNKVLEPSIIIINY
jgi:hypothetical protein